MTHRQCWNGLICGCPILVLATLLLDAEPARADDKFEWALSVPAEQRSEVGNLLVFGTIRWLDAKEEQERINHLGELWGTWRSRPTDENWRRLMTAVDSAPVPDRREWIVPDGESYRLTAHLLGRDKEWSQRVEIDVKKWKSNRGNSEDWDRLMESVRSNERIRGKLEGASPRLEQSFVELRKRGGAIAWNRCLVGMADVAPRSESKLMVARQEFVLEASEPIFLKLAESESGEPGKLGIQFAASVASRDEKNWFELIKMIMGLAISKKVETNVTFRTVDGAKKERVGATVKYRADQDTQVVATKGSTSTTESLTIGLYHVWAERDQKRVTEVKVVSLVKPSEMVDLVEAP